jgi:hypothetical protein
VITYKCHCTQATCCVLYSLLYSLYAVPFELILHHCTTGTVFASSQTTALLKWIFNQIFCERILTAFRCTMSLGFSNAVPQLCVSYILITKINNPMTVLHSLYWQHLSFELCGYTLYTSAHISVHNCFQKVCKKEFWNVMRIHRHLQLSHIHSDTLLCI